MTAECVGSYVLVRLLGRGGMGEVYLARDPRLEREVALKILPSKLAEEPQRLSRFLREARAIAALKHPNIATKCRLNGYDAPLVARGPVR